LSWTGVYDIRLVSITNKGVGTFTIKIPLGDICEISTSDSSNVFVEKVNDNYGIWHDQLRKTMVLVKQSIISSPHNGDENILALTKTLTIDIPVISG